jgi:hypothetical protein
MEKISDSRLKSIFCDFGVLSGLIFTHGEQEFIFVAHELIKGFPTEEFDLILQFYVKTNIKFKLEKGNCYHTFMHASAEKRRGNLTYEQVFSLLGIIYAVSLGFNPQGQPLLSIEQSKQFVARQVNQVFIIEDYPDYFQTKDNDKVGTKDNPLLLAGVKGVDDYFKALRTIAGDTLSYNRNRSLHLTWEAHDILYSLDVYELTNEVTGQLLGEVWVNIYGIDNCVLCPPGYRLVEQAITW